MHPVLFAMIYFTGFFAIIFYSQRNKYNKYVEIISRIVCYNKDFELKKKCLIQIKVLQVYFREFCETQEKKVG